jgi:hypothetical protein
MGGFQPPAPSLVSSPSVAVEGPVERSPDGDGGGGAFSLARWRGRGLRRWSGGVGSRGLARSAAASAVGAHPPHGGGAPPAEAAAFRPAQHVWAGGWAEAKGKRGGSLVLVAGHLGGASGWPGTVCLQRRLLGTMAVPIVGQTAACWIPPSIPQWWSWWAVVSAFLCYGDICSMPLGSGVVILSWPLVRFV